MAGNEPGTSEELHQHAGPHEFEKTVGMKKTMAGHQSF